ncbi:MAG TPA: CAP domain-containing protein [Solirubrobacterales bacterium]
MSALVLVAVGGAALPAQASAAICPGAGAVIATENVTEAEDALLCLVNVYRAERGVPVLTHDPILRGVARAHSQDMIDRDFFDHVNPDGDGPGDRAQNAGYPGSVGENIAQVFLSPPSAKRFFTIWRNSPGHNSNMLDLHGVRTRTAGMGFALAGATWTGTQMFGTVQAGGTENGLDCSRAREYKRGKRSALDKARARAKQAKRASKRAASPKAKRRAKRKLKRARKAVKAAKKRVTMASRVVKAAC